MAITQSKFPANGGNAYFQTGRYLDDAASPGAAEIVLGFTPSYFAWIDLTNLDKYEWFHGMANDTAIATAATGARTLLSSGGISVDVGSGNQTGAAGTPTPGTQKVENNSATQTVGVGPAQKVIVAAALVQSNAQYAWIAIG